MWMEWGLSVEEPGVRVRGMINNRLESCLYALVQGWREWRRDDMITRLFSKELLDMVWYKLWFPTKSLITVIIPVQSCKFMCALDPSPNPPCTLKMKYFWLLMWRVLQTAKILLYDHSLGLVRELGRHAKSLFPSLGHSAVARIYNHKLVFWIIRWKVLVHKIHI